MCKCRLSSGYCEDRTHQVAFSEIRPNPTLAECGNVLLNSALTLAPAVSALATFKHAGIPSYAHLDGDYWESVHADAPTPLPFDLDEVC